MERRFYCCFYRSSRYHHIKTVPIKETELKSRILKRVISGVIHRSQLIIACTIIHRYSSSPPLS